MKSNLDNFSCQRCGFCCSLSGYVILKKDEVGRIADFLNLELYEFTENYTMLTSDRTQLSLSEKKNGKCIFLEADNRCRIQSVKPLQCQGFPYKWRSKDLEEGCQGFASMHHDRSDKKKL